ncbi:hypothetical protein E4U47_002596 [Claviceps purpurea]|nr:hypothetical protein E4U47_002596 [Claviceps purpurea]
MWVTVAVPTEDVENARACYKDDDDWKRNTLHLTAVGQYLAFTLRVARRSKKPGQGERRAVFENIPRWDAK